MRCGSARMNSFDLTSGGGSKLRREDGMECHAYDWNVMFVGLSLSLVYAVLYDYGTWGLVLNMLKYRSGFIKTHYRARLRAGHVCRPCLGERVVVSRMVVRELILFCWWWWIRA